MSGAPFAKELLNRDNRQREGIGAITQLLIFHDLLFTPGSRSGEAETDSWVTSFGDRRLVVFRVELTLAVQPGSSHPLDASIR